MAEITEDLKATVKAEIFRDNVSEDEYAEMLKRADSTEVVSWYRSGSNGYKLPTPRRGIVS